jgi:nucleoside-diphosphate-sugar epimerase
MKILITGIHGFVGSNLVQSLKENHKIYGLDIISPEKDGVIKTFSWNELSQISDIDVIIHLAGKAHDTKNKTDKKVYFDVNFGLTKTIFDWFLQSNTPKFIFFSTVKAAADTVKGDILMEDVVPLPVGAYGESKIKAENYILNNVGAENFLPLQKKYYILRPAMIHGAGNKGNFNLLYNFVSKGIPYPLGAYENKRSFTSIDNLSFVINSLIDNNIQSNIYNICDDETLSTNELIKLIAKVKNQKPQIWKINKRLIAFFAKIGDILHLPLNSERLRKLTENYVVSNEKIISALKIEKMPISATEGFEKTIKSFEKF